MVGAVVSTTVTACVQIVLLVQESIALQVRVAMKDLPHVWLVSVRTTTLTFRPSQLSKAVGASKLQAVPHSTVLEAAQNRTGGVVSTTVMVWEQVARLEQASVACQVHIAEGEITV